MPFCTNCGTLVDSRATFCHNCGTPQPRPGTAAHPDFLQGISDRTASILCYIPVFGVIPAIIFLASQKYRSNIRVRFNAFQAIYLFVAWLIISSVLPSIFLGGFPGSAVEHALLALIRLAMFACWIYLLIKAASEQQVHLPVLGDLAARSAAEQV